MEKLRKARLREIPAVNEIINHPEILQIQTRIPTKRVTEIAQRVLATVRTKILADSNLKSLELNIDADSIVNEVKEEVFRTFDNCLKRVINGTGIVLHTNCGRSVLPQSVLDFVTSVAAGYSNLELDLSSGERGSRYVHVEELLCKLTGAEAAIVVNNNAAALLLVMRTLAHDKEVIVSRGELVEVGGSFRIPEVLKAGGSSLSEVGATNKAYLLDYENAITEKTAILLKVHTSNFQVVGFTKAVSSSQLVELGKKKGIPVVEDLGSGSLVDLSQFGLPYEPTVQETVESGVDLVTFSGDKLLGGPQAGVIVGKKRYIDMLKGNQLTRALRVDKLTLAALEATLRLYLEQRESEIPTLSMLSISLEELRNMADSLTAMLSESCPQLSVAVEEGFSQAGGGSLPTAKLPTYLVSITAASRSVDQLEEFLRLAATPVLARIHKDKLLLDVRTLLPGEAETIVEVLKGLGE